MDYEVPIDTSFDFRSDAGVTRAGVGRDPDRFSATLRAYHRFLWSKPLPGGAPFDLSDVAPNGWLHHRSGLGEFYLSSDSIVHSLRSFRAMSELARQVPSDDVDRFNRLSYTIGGMTLFPANKIDGKPTINGARGMHPGIRDRFDLTLECIRRHYACIVPNPLGQVLERYADFFRLFQTFRGYVEFFLLEDLVNTDFSGVRFFTPFEDFPTSALPRSVESYQLYRKRSMGFVTARNARIAAFSSAQ